MKHIIIAAITITGLFFSTSLFAGESKEDEGDNIFSWFREHFTIGGTLEIEAWWGEDFDGVSDNSIDLASSEIEIEAEITEWAAGSVVFEWDDDEDKFGIDEAIVQLGPTDDFPAYFQVGRFTVPFGLYDGNTVTDPLTKEVFEIKEDAAMIGMELNDFYTSVYLFDSDASDGDDNSIFEQYGVTIGYKLKKEAYKFDCSLGYVNSVTGSDTLSEEYDMEAGYVAGLTAQMGVRVAGFVFLAEYVGAIENYHPSDEEEESTRPSSYHLEAGYNTAILRIPALFTVAYSQSSDLADIEPRRRMSTVLWLGLIDGIGLNLEYTQDRDYGLASGGSGEKADIYTIQLSYEF